MTRRGRRRGLLPAAVLIAGIGTLPAAPEPGNQEPDEPRPTELVEETRSRLAQIEVTVTGPADVVTHLAPEDFKLKIHTRWLESFELDRHCSPGSAPQADAAAPAPRPTLSYVFYFDQTHLTLAGRAQALDIARVLVERLIRGGDRGMVVSAARRLALVEDFTDDPATLLAAIDRLETDRTQWDFFASEEESRVAQVIDVLNDDENLQRAIATARGFQREEVARTDKSLRRLAITLTRLSEVESGKAVVYFADTMRQNPGEHYLSFFGSNVQRSDASLSDLGSDSFAAGVAFDRVINEAAAQGIRLYSVYSAGLVAPFDRERVSAEGATRSGAVASSSRVRFRDAQSSLASMASETGGDAFLRGESPANIAARVLADFDCMYTLSFDPGALPEDEPLRVIVEMLRPDVKVDSRGRIVLQSESTRLAARLLSAFAVGSAQETEIGIRAHLVPTGFRDGAYGALLQISVPGTRIPAAQWELGATLIHRDRVVGEVSGTLSASLPGAPLVLEREIRVRPGTQEVVAVAREVQTDSILREHLFVTWPDPNRRPVTCVPLSLLQPAAGAFVREGSPRTRGSLALAPDEPIAVDRPTALMSLVCRSRRHKAPLRVERSLTGGTTVDFPQLQFELEGDRCAQVRDMIPADTLSPGTYRYDIRVLSEGQVLEEASREFVAATPES